MGAAAEPCKVSCDACRVAVFTSPEGEVGSDQEEIGKSGSWILTSALMPALCHHGQLASLGLCQMRVRPFSLTFHPCRVCSDTGHFSTCVTAHLPQPATPSYLAFPLLADKLLVPTSEYFICCSLCLERSSSPHIFPRLALLGHWKSAQGGLP